MKNKKVERLVEGKGTKIHVQQGDSQKLSWCYPKDLKVMSGFKTEY